MSPLTGVSAWLVQKQNLSNLGSDDAALNTDVFIRVGEQSWELFKETYVSSILQTSLFQEQLLTFSSFAHAQGG